MTAIRVEDTVFSKVQVANNNSGVGIFSCISRGMSRVLNHSQIVRNTHLIQVFLNNSSSVIMEQAILGVVVLVCQGIQGLQAYSALPGYAGIKGPNPTYEEDGGTTGHAEIVIIDFDPSLISFQFSRSSPYTTRPNLIAKETTAQTGRSCIMPVDDEQREKAIQRLKLSKPSAIQL